VATNAEQDARARGQEHVSPQHYLLALLNEGEGLGWDLMRLIGVPLDRLREEIDQELGRQGEPTSHAPAVTPQLTQVLHVAQTESIAMGAEHLGTEHILLGLAADGSGAGQALARWQATPDRIRAEIHGFLTMFLHECPPPREQPVEPPITVPDDIRELSERIDRLRQEKEIAVDNQDFDAAAEKRTAEKDLLAQRADRIREWSSRIDVLALVQEVVVLRDQVSHLRQLAAAQGVDLSVEVHESSSGTEAPG
jgi:ATP-dependent Clp protease ATP-binding subunit ClpA